MATNVSAVDSNGSQSALSGTTEFVSGPNNTPPPMKTKSGLPFTPPSIPGFLKEADGDEDGNSSGAEGQFQSPFMLATALLSQKQAAAANEAKDASATANTTQPTNGA